MCHPDLSGEGVSIIILFLKFPSIKRGGFLIYQNDGVCNEFDDLNGLYYSMTKYLYDKNLKRLAAKLRNNSTLAETLLWNELKGKRMMGYDFHRQKPLGNYIVDFYSPKLKLIIEVDGVTHNYKMGEDVKRQIKLESMSLTVIRFLDSDVRNNLSGVLLIIKKGIEENMDG